MKRTKQEKAITLVALIITIIILLILAVVTIAAISGDGDLISHANNAKAKYTEEAAKENTTIQNYLDKIPEEIGDSKEKTVGKTLNKDCAQTSEIQTVLELRGWDNIDNNSNPKYKLVYKNTNNEEITVKVIIDTTLEHPVISLEYGNNEYRIASEAVKSINLRLNYGHGIYDIANEWTVENGTITGKFMEYDDKEYTSPHYTEVTEFPVFEGTWQIDESQSTALGIQYLSGVLIDS